jgi:hypothetical protein
LSLPTPSGQRKRRQENDALPTTVRCARGHNCWRGSAYSSGHLAPPTHSSAARGNLAKRLLRGIAVTRKNFLFLGSDSGGDRAAIIYTIIETAKLNGLDPEAYLASVLDRLARGHPNNRPEKLLPWNFMPSQALAA